MISKVWQNVFPGDVTTIQVPTRVRVVANEPSPDGGHDVDAVANMRRVSYEVLDTMVTTFDVGRMVVALVEENPDDA